MRFIHTEFEVVVTLQVQVALQVLDVWFWKIVQGPRHRVKCMNTYIYGYVRALSERVFSFFPEGVSKGKIGRSINKP